MARGVEDRRIVGECEGGGSPTETSLAPPSSDAAEVWGVVSAGTRGTTLYDRYIWK